MKRWMILLLAAILLLSGCGADEGFLLSPNTAQVSFYYLAEETASYRSGEGPLVFESRVLTAEQLEPRAFLELYFAGPLETGARLPFFSQMQIKDLVLEDGVLSLMLSYDWNNMSQLERKMAEICLLRTVIQLPDVKQLKINGKALQEDDYVLVDRSGVDDQVAVKLYYSDMSGRHLMQEIRNRETGTEQSLQEFVLNELLAGPQNDDFLSALPEGTRLLGMELVQGTCIINFSEEFLANKPESHMQARMVIFSVVNSLTELSQIESVRFLCVGKEIRSYVGLDLSGVIYRDEMAVSHTRQSESSLDVTLYIPLKDGSLAAVPVYVRQTVGRMGVDAVMSALLSFKTANGYENPFPSGTLMLNQKTEDGICTVTFNSAFARDTVDARQRETAVRCVVTTLCGLEGIRGVQIRINDEEEVWVDYGDVLTPQSEWLLQP